MYEPDSSPTGILTLSTEGVDTDTDPTSMDYMHKYDSAVSIGELERNLSVGTTPTRGGPGASGTGAPKTPNRDVRSRSETLVRPVTPGHQRVKQWKRLRQTPRWPCERDDEMVSVAETETEAEAEVEMDVRAEEVHCRPTNDDQEIEADAAVLLNSEAEYWTATGGSLGHSSSLILEEAIASQIIDTQATLSPCAHEPARQHAMGDDSQAFDSQDTAPLLQVQRCPMPTVDSYLPSHDVSSHEGPSFAQEVKLEISPCTAASIPSHEVAPSQGARSGSPVHNAVVLYSQATSAAYAEDPNSNGEDPQTQSAQSSSARSLWERMTSSAPGALGACADAAARSQFLHGQDMTETAVEERLVEKDEQSMEVVDPTILPASNVPEPGSHTAEAKDARPGRSLEEEDVIGTSESKEEEIGSWSIDYLIGPGVPGMNRQLYEDEYETAADKIDTEIAALQQEYNETNASLTLWLRRGREVQAERDICRLYSALNAVQGEEGQLDEKHAKIREFSSRIQAAMAAFGGMTGALF